MLIASVQMLNTKLWLWPLVNLCGLGNPLYRLQFNVPYENQTWRRSCCPRDL